ncbi:selenocysteine lyase [Clostridium acetobutylicum]|nr:selenocysteine lyase [Clostridium acetobutylicum]
MDYRKYFEKLKSDYVYLDNAATTPPLKSVMKKALEFLENYSSIHRGTGYLAKMSTDSYENSRKVIGEYLHATKDDVVVFTANTTDSINKFALLYPFMGNEGVLISDIEHSSNMLPWFKNSGRVKMFNTGKSNKINPYSIEEELYRNPQIKIVSICGASNLTGYLTPLRDIYKICKKYGVYLLVDASQIAPHFKITLDDCDFIAFSGHKMYAPFGAGVLAGRKDVLSHIGLAPTGGGNIVYIGKRGEVIYKEPPLSLEAGTPNGLGAVTVAEAMRVLNEDIGWENMNQHNKRINEIGYKYLSDLSNIKLYYPKDQDIRINRTPTFVFDFKNVGTKVGCDILKENKIGVRCGTFCLYRLIEKVKNIDEYERKRLYRNYIVPNRELPERYSLVRASAGLMTTEEDFLRLRAAIKKVG